ncbi:MAG: leucine-rich repeat protein [Firmicutes bacterium]|nr:leucine-rich repeat protein [Bacillota bacterium]
MTDGLTFRLINSDAEYEVTGYTGTRNGAPTRLVFPDTYEGKPVTRIAASAFASYPTLKSVKFPQSLKEIGASAFQYCYNMMRVDIPAGVTSIGASAFGISQSEYTYMSLKVNAAAPPAQSVFRTAGYVRAIVVPAASVAAYRTAWPTYSAKIYPDTSVVDDCLIIENNIVVAYVGDVKEVNIPSGVTSIAANAFLFSPHITRVTIPASVTAVGSEALRGCNAATVFMAGTQPPTQSTSFGSAVGVKAIVVPDGTEAAYKAAWSTYAAKVQPASNIVGGKFLIASGVIVAYFGSDREVAIPAGVTGIGSRAFHGADLLGITVPADTAMGTFAFGYTGSNYVSSVNTLSNLSMTVYTDGTGWTASYWNHPGRPVVTGCTLSADKSYVVSFTKTAAAITNPATVGGTYAPCGTCAPCRAGFTFGGWATESGGVAAYTAEDVSTAPNGTVLYALWLSNQI